MLADIKYIDAIAIGPRVLSMTFMHLLFLVTNVSAMENRNEDIVMSDNRNDVELVLDNRLQNDPEKKAECLDMGKK